MRQETCTHVQRSTACCQHSARIRRCRNHHLLTFQIPTARTDIYKGSFFRQTIRDWNALPDSFISSAEGVEGGVARFTSLIEVRTNFHVNFI